MEFEIDQSKLNAALSLVQAVADKRSAMPVLANVLINAHKDGHVVFSATDMMISLTESVPAEVKSPGALTLAVRSLYGVTRTLPDRPIKVRALDNHWAQLTVGRNEFKLMGTAHSDFPELPDPSGLDFTSAVGHALADLIQKTQFSVSTDDARTNLNGVLLECDGETATMVSTDGHRLTKYSAPLTGPKLGKGIIIPRKGMVEIRKVLDRIDGAVELAVNGQYIFVRAGELLLSVKLNNVTFPPYQLVIPGSYKRRVKALRDELLGVLRRAEVMAPEKTATVRLEIGSGSLQITADNPDLGVAHQEIEVEYAGEGLVAGFNARYLIEVLEVIETPKVFLDFQNELDPCVIRPVEGSDFLGVIMPMRI